MKSRQNKKEKKNYVPNRNLQNFNIFFPSDVIPMVNQPLELELDLLNISNMDFLQIQCTVVVDENEEEFPSEIIPFGVHSWALKFTPPVSFFFFFGDLFFDNFFFVSLFLLCLFFTLVLLILFNFFFPDDISALTANFSCFNDFQVESVSSDSYFSMERDDISFRAEMLGKVMIHTMEEADLSQYDLGRKK